MSSDYGSEISYNCIDYEVCRCAWLVYLNTCIYRKAFTDMCVSIDAFISLYNMIYTCIMLSKLFFSP